ncbi:hypothetical protein GCM10023231_23140 [Olivibacter ginsenosidimutans]|uniref:Secretin/TonB short N-terminal domain-containing protein n=2 Tax=Olivibacter ginsenosidimutans TaxID=1176537 RepID=A0ABP9BEH0_9SPHI
MLSTAGFAVFSQNYLYQPVTVHVNHQKLADVLANIGQQGGFHFAYSSGIIPADSLVVLQNFKGDVKTALNLLIGDGYAYQQSPNHLIIRPAPFKLTLMPEEVGEGKRVYTIKGTVVDEQTGRGIYQASVYEKRLLVGTLTDKKGRFKLKLKTKDGGPMVLTVSKQLYKDTTTVFLPTANLTDKSQNSRYGYMDGDGNAAANTALGRLFLSSKQRLNALNLGNFFAYMPVQISLTPGLSSHGMMSGQVVNKFSANLIGGYTAGVNGVEVAGIFNMDRYHVQYVQAAGAINVVGSNLSGVQLAGIYNKVLDSLKGVQAAGLFNLVKQEAKGVQLAGFANSAHELKGLQIAGGLNRTKNNHHGVQFGIVNIADTTSGISIGLVNIIGNGFKRLSIATNEVHYAELAFKSGDAKLYSVISVGLGAWNGGKAPITGFGIGHEFNPHEKQHYFAAELVAQQVYGKTFENIAGWPKLNVLYNIALSKRTKVFVAPSVNLLIKSKQTVEGEKEVLSDNYPFLVNNERTKWWAGLALGISFF